MGRHPHLSGEGRRQGAFDRRIEIVGSRSVSQRISGGISDPPALSGRPILADYQQSRIELYAIASRTPAPRSASWLAALAAPGFRDRLVTRRMRPRPLCFLQSCCMHESLREIARSCNDPSGRERLIEVKTTNGGATTPFFLSRNEYETAAARADSWQLYRVHLFAQTPRIFTISPPLLASVHLRTETWRASFS